MTVLLMFGNTEEEANLNFIIKMYNLINDIELRKTGYFIDDKTGGILNKHPLKENTETFDPKARTFEFEDGYILGHAGLTSNIEDIQFFFGKALNHLMYELKREQRQLEEELRYELKIK